MILQVGKKEFLEKGFKDASLRGIVKEAGYTQGAFYGYYPDKAALFEALVEPAAGDLIAQFRQAQQAHFDLIPVGNTGESHALSTDYLRRFVAYIYDHFDAFKLVICCSEGTQYASYIDDLVAIDEAQSEVYFSELKKLGVLEGRVSPTLRHMLTSAYFTAVFETVRHDMPKDEALNYIEELAMFFNNGWASFFTMG